MSTFLNNVECYSSIYKKLKKKSLLFITDSFQALRFMALLAGGVTDISPTKVANTTDVNAKVTGITDKYTARPSYKAAAILFRIKKIPNSLRSVLLPPQ